MKIAIINGHPNQDSFCNALVESYTKGAIKAGAEIRTLGLSRMDFNPILQFGYKKRMVEEPNLLWAKESIEWADHLVFIYPIWWGTMPSLLKGFIDRVFTPGFAFNYIEGSFFNKKLLSGKTARVIYTSDAPSWYVRLVWRNIPKVQIKQVLLNFCGVSPVKITHFSSIKWKKPEKLESWMDKVYGLGYKLA